MVNYVSVDGVSFKVFFVSRNSQLEFERYVFEKKKQVKFWNKSKNKKKK